MHNTIFALILSSVLMAGYLLLRYLLHQVKLSWKLQSQYGNDIIDVLSQSESSYTPLNDIVLQMATHRYMKKCGRKRLMFFIKSVCRSLEAAGAIKKEPGQSEPSYMVLFGAKDKWKRYLDFSAQIRRSLG